MDKLRGTLNAGKFNNIYYKDWIGKYPQDVLGLFQTSYNITQERMFGAYTAYKLEPK